MTAIAFLTRRVYRRSPLIAGVAANIFEATRAARSARKTGNPSERAFFQTEEARHLMLAASLALRDQGISTETLLRVAANMAERCAQGVDLAEELEAAR